MIKTDEIIEFILANKSDKVFKAYSLEDLRWTISDCIENSTIVVVTDANDTIVGVAIGRKCNHSKTMFVKEALTIKRGVLKHLIKKFRALYPGYALEACRRGKIRFYDTTTLCNKILAYV